jgi:hypothetical protein
LESGKRARGCLEELLIQHEEFVDFVRVEVSLFLFLVLSARLPVALPVEKAGLSIR